jgi:hypothetical protein
MSRIIPVLLDAAHYPRPGVWLRIAGRSTLRLSLPLPRHVLATRVNRSLFIPEQADGPPTPRLLRTWRLVRSLRLFVVGRRRSGEHRFDVRLVRRSGNRTVVIATDQARVLHVSDEPILCPTTERLRRRWAEHVTSPGFVPSACGCKVEEVFLRGRHVADLSADEEVQVIRRIFAMHRALALAEAREPSERLRAHFRARAPRAVIGPQTSSIDNIVVMDGPEPAFIDIHPLAEMPFYAQPLRVLRNWGRVTWRPLERVQDGHFDGDIVDLLQAGGLEVPRGRRPSDFFTSLPTPTEPVSMQHLGDRHRVDPASSRQVVPAALESPSNALRGATR